MSADASQLFSLRGETEVAVLNGKKERRVLLRVSEEMEKQIRAGADREYRTVSDHIRYLLATALSQLAGTDGKETIEQLRQSASTK